MSERDRESERAILSDRASYIEGEREIERERGRKMEQEKERMSEIER